MSICVLGAANRDLVLRVSTLPHAGETVLARELSVGTGGKGVNQAVAASRAGATTTFVGVVGDDGDELLEVLRRSGVTVLVERLPGESGSAIVVVDDAGENLIVVAPGVSAGWTPTAAQRRRIAEADQLVLQLELGRPMALETARLARDARVVLNASPAPDDLAGWEGLIDLLVVNEHEALRLTGTDAFDSAAIAALLEIAPSAVVTLGARGCVVLDGTAVERIPAVRVDPVDTTGAGDTFCGYLVAALDEGMPLPDAARLATAAAAVSVARPGATSSIPLRGDVAPVAHDPEP